MSNASSYAISIPITEKSQTLCTESKAVDDNPQALSLITQKLRKNLADASHQLVESGALLLKAKEILPHGQFQAWLRENFNMSAKTANRLMALAKMVRELNLGPDTVAKLLNLDLSVIYEISSKSTSAEVRKKIFDEISKKDNISYERVKNLKKNHASESESHVISKTEFTQFVRVLKQFSSWFDHHQFELEVASIQIQDDLKLELELYAQKLKAASDVVDEILEQTKAVPIDVISSKLAHPR